MTEKAQNTKASPGPSRPDAGTDEVAAHYETLLAEHYSWMMGDFAECVAGQKRLFTELGLADGAGRQALDLGCGSGFQSLALAEMGYAVRAVDGSAKLLAELDRRKGALAVETLRHDLRDVRAVTAPGTDLIVCMGDTLPHLADKTDVVALFADIRDLLTPGGHFVVSFRDQTAALTGTDRFLSLRSDENRIMTCFLEYEPDCVRVHDLVHIREETGWRLHKSSYRKLRLSADWCREQLEKAGLHVCDRRKVRGMDCFAAERIDGEPGPARH